MRQQLHELVVDQLAAMCDIPHWSWSDWVVVGDVVLELVREHLQARAELARAAEHRGPYLECPVCDVVAWLGEEVR